MQAMSIRAFICFPLYSGCVLVAHEYTLRSSFEAVLNKMQRSKHSVHSLEGVEHDDGGLLPRGAAGGTGGIRETRDFQHRPRISVYQRGMDRHAEGGRSVVLPKEFISLATQPPPVCGTGKDT